MAVNPYRITETKRLSLCSAKGHYRGAKSLDDSHYYIIEQKGKDSERCDRKGNRAISKIVTNRWWVECICGNIESSENEGYGGGGDDGGGIRWYTGGGRQRLVAKRSKLYLTDLSRD
ncbi:hypothetical protein PV327_007752 [Microctonus hyperodae]|uniref:Uncharacterized protein n=1 Tax=Microctonus hyperodae TaxID=165561 RepID=A0AA39FZV4_MICHY|nr:hypothetical protein PV327_007752 [Microctonus hyperodae]